MSRGAPGASPLFFSQRAMDKLKSRKTKPISFCWVSAVHSMCVSWILLQVCSPV